MLLFQRILSAVFFGALFLCSPAAYASTETAALAPVFEQAGHSLAEGKKPLVVFDIDNVLLCDDLFLGNRAWFRSLYSDYLNPLRTENPALFKSEEEKLSVLLASLEKVSSKKLVEAEIPKRLRALQSAGIKAMVLTGRHASAMAHTIADLKAKGVDVSASTPIPDIDALAIPGEKGQGACKSGVCFGALQDKGRMLVSLLERAAYRPDVLIFVDDSPRNTRAVESAFKDFGIPCLAFRYSRRDKLLQSYETAGIQAAARVQLKEFLINGRLLENEKAQALSKTAPVTVEEELKLIFGSRTELPKM